MRKAIRLNPNEIDFHAKSICSTCALTNSPLADLMNCRDGILASASTLGNDFFFFFLEYVHTNTA